MIRNYLITAAIPVVFCLFAGCSSQQLYGAGQEYQRNKCLHIPDKTESDRCLSKLDPSYEDYKRERDAATKK